VTLDFALAEGREGTLVLHRVDCPGVRLMAELGFPVVSMFGCERMPEDYPLHSCLLTHAAHRHDQGDQSRPDATK
jgi:hypothetical protein